VWTTEALFPNYLFARFDLGAAGQQVERVPGVIEVVRFGPHCPAIPEPVIEDLRRHLGVDQVHVLQDQFVPGDSVQIESGPFEGLGGVVTRVMPASERVRVLLELLGRQTSVELPTSVVRAARDVRQGLFTNSEGNGCGG
jgi:transcriptional antiterminator RfaH